MVSFIFDERVNLLSWQVLGMGDYDDWQWGWSPTGHAERRE